MKVISLIQPWATLWVMKKEGVPLKACETRSWPCYTNGPIFVHATKEVDKVGFQRLKPYLPFASPDDMPVSMIVGIVWLSKCYRTDDFKKNNYDPYNTGYDLSTELIMGDFSPTRFAWYTSDRERLARQEMMALGTVPGHQGIWTMPPALSQHVFIKMLFKMMKERAIERRELKI